MTASATTHRPWSAIVCGVPDAGTLLIVDWILLAARNAGYRAQALPLPAGNSLPYGMYIEVANSDESQCSLSGVPWGHVDVVIAGEHGQLSKALAAGYSDPDRTTIISSCMRQFGHGEQALPFYAVTREQAVDRAAAAVSARYVAFDTSDVVSWYHLPQRAQTALLFGAVFGSGVLAMNRDACHDAIEQLGISVEDSVRAFRRGERFGRRSGARIRRVRTASQFVRGRRGQLPWAERDGFEALIRRADELFPAESRDIVRAGIFELTDFQSVEYAEQLVEHCSQVLQQERATYGDNSATASVVPEVARHLTAMLAYPDLARIAQLKLRASRLRSVRQQHGIGRTDDWSLTEYIPVDAAEADHLSRSAVRRAQSLPTTVGEDRVVSVVTSSLRGALQLRRWKRLRSRREDSARHRHEVETAAAYTAAVMEALEVEPRLAPIVAESGGLVRGAGVVRVAQQIVATTFWGFVVRQSLAVDRDRPRSIDRDHGVGMTVVPRLYRQLNEQGPTALWDEAHHIVGIAMHTARGGSWFDAYAWARQLCGLEPVRLQDSASDQPAVAQPPSSTAPAKAVS